MMRMIPPTFLLGAALFAADAPLESIARWMDFKDAAVSIVFDDNSENQFDYAVPLMDARGIRGTFFVVPDWSGSVWEMIRSASRSGHEIGSHTVSHPDMAALADSDLASAEKELKDSKETIERMLPGKKCLTLAWPFNRYNPRSEKLASKHYISARQGEGTLEVESPGNMFAVRSIPFTESPRPMNGFADQAIGKGRWLIELLHRVHPTPYALSYTNDDSLRIHLDYLVSKRNSLWIAPYGEVIRYIIERDSSILGMVRYGRSEIEYSLTSNLDAGIYGLPLSVRILLPKGCTGKSASQGNDSIGIENVIENGRNTVRLRAVPNKGPIVLKVESGPLESAFDWRISREAGYDLKTDPSMPNTVAFRPPARGTFSVKVFDSLGKEMGERFEFKAEPGFSYRLSIAASRIAKGKCFIAIYSGADPVMKRGLVLE